MDAALTTLLPAVLLMSNQGGSVGLGSGAWLQPLKQLLPVLLIFLLKFAQDNFAKWAGALSSVVRARRQARVVHRVSASFTLTENQYGGCNVPQQFKAVMHDIHQYLSGHLEPHKLPSYTIVSMPINHCNHIEVVHFRAGSSTSNSVSFSPSAPGIVITAHHAVKSTSRQSGEAMTHTYTLDVASNDNKQTSIKAYLDGCSDRHDALLRSIVKTPQVFELAGTGQAPQSSPIFTMTPFEATKSFSNMFFANKASLIRDLDRFAKSSDEYLRLGIPYTFGMMLHGKPGTGKTSAIKAIAKHTGRHIVILPTRKLGSVAQLKRIMLSRTLGGYDVPSNKRLYVFEEIDCGQWASIVASRKQQQLTANTASHATVEAADSALSLLKKMEGGLKEKEGDGVGAGDEASSLGDLLELLDGIIETPGRMIIFTSNHPERIDEALLRPGRIDRMIMFDNMTRHDIADMYRLWFGCDLPSHIRGHITDHVFSQAQIGNMFATAMGGNARDMAELHRLLTTVPRALQD